MPYRLNPKDKREVQVERSSGWELLKRHKTENGALKHLAALKINVGH